MRLTEDRYSRDRLRLDLALRFIRHEARTQTIRQWTGLTDDRIRKLYRAYVRSEPAVAVRRRRGKSPRLASFFTRSRGAQVETAALASIMSICGVLPQSAASESTATLQHRVRDAGTGAAAANRAAEPVARAGSGVGSRLHATLRLPAAAEVPARGGDTQRALPGLPRGERLCAAYEAYRRALPDPMISFEHAVFLATALTGGAELQALRCAACGSLGVVDPIALRTQACLDCGDTLSCGLRVRPRAQPGAQPGAAGRAPRLRAGRLSRPSDH